MNHKIAVSVNVETGCNLLQMMKVKKYIRTALEEQGVSFPCEINVMITDDETIRAINLASRKLDSATDVLSFPMFGFKAGELPEDPAALADPATGLVPLGDMAISWEHAKAQAKEFGHSVSRELGYLTVHSVLHLLGYDHMDEGAEKRQMRQREEQILGTLGLLRN